MRLEIDGRVVAAQEGQTILEAARAAGIAIPSLCDHPGLAPFGGCRLCLVEVRGSKAFLPSCAVRAEEGMTVATNTPRLRDLRRRILELILSEHPYACLVCAEKDACDDMKSTIRKVGETTGCVLCPSNGRCELQRVCAEVGLDAVTLPAAYRNRDVRRDDPFFDRDPNSCILCGRCVRVCDEVRGAAVLAFFERGPETEVGTAFGRTLLDAGCQFCGACVDVCPTASLVERGSRPDLRPDRTARTVCPLCGHGCELVVELRDGRVQAARPSASGSANGGQACVRGRFVIRELAAGPGRLTQPLVRKGGVLEPVGWDEALDFAAGGLRRFRPEEVVFLGGGQVALEDAVLLAEFDRRFHGGAQRGGTPPAPGNAVVRFDRAEIAAAGTVILFGLDLPVTHPIAWLEAVRAGRRGAALAVVDTGCVPPLRREALRVRIKAQDAAGLLAAILSAVSGEKASASPRPPDLAALFDLAAKRPPAVLLYDAGLLLPRRVEGRSGALRVIPLLGAVNANGLRLAGVREAEDGSGATAKAVLSLGRLPAADVRRGEFAVAVRCFQDGDEAVDAVLPAASFLERSGTYVNLEGRVLKFDRVLDPPGQAKPDGWILAELAGRLGIEGLRASTEAALAELECPTKEDSVAGGVSAPVLRPLAAETELDHYRGLDLERAVKGLRAVRAARRRRTGGGR